MIIIVLDFKIKALYKYFRYTSYGRNKEIVEQCQYS